MFENEWVGRFTSLSVVVFALCFPRIHQYLPGALGLPGEFSQQSCQALLLLNLLPFITLTFLFHRALLSPKAESLPASLKFGTVCMLASAFGTEMFFHVSDDYYATRNFSPFIIGALLVPAFALGVFFWETCDCLTKRWRREKICPGMQLLRSFRWY